MFPGDWRPATRYGYEGPMTQLYDQSPVAIRVDLEQAHRETVRSWAAPGNHWTGAERLAMVALARSAREADELPPWISPTTVDGLVGDDEILPGAAIDAVWRLATHPGTLTESWYRDIIGRGLSPERYVELVAVVATAVCVDVFSAAIGVDPIRLPDPAEGRPDGRVIAGAAVTGHWVPTVAGRGANVGRALTAVPVAVEAWLRLSDVQYVPPEALIKDLTWSRGALDRMQVELLAARTSLLNECFY